MICNARQHNSVEYRQKFIFLTEALGAFSNSKTAVNKTNAAQTPVNFFDATFYDIK